MQITRRIIILMLIISALLLIAAACDNPSSIVDHRTEEVANIPKSNALVDQPVPTIDVCEPLDVPGVAFPRQEYVEGPRTMMVAELVGDLALIDGCLKIDSLYGDGTVIPVWPAEFTITAEGDTIIVYDGDGNPVVREGEEVYMGGGEGAESGLLDCVHQQLPDSCSGKYWYVGDGVRPNLRFDSELFNLSLITATERTAIFLQKKPILDEWKDAASIITGKLVLYTPMRCPRIHSESGRYNYMPIWPPDYSLEFNDGNIEIKDESGKVIASEGDELTLSGGGIPHSWESEEYRRLYYQLPGDCHAPYWIVDR